MNIKVSIIVPVYNVEKYLRQCLDSLINQTLQEIEIICVDDGSTDNSSNILSDYAQKDSRIIVHRQENQGLANARNAGLKLANGEYIGFVDSDDFVDIDFFEKLYQAASSDNADIARALYKYHYPDSEKLDLYLDKIIKQRIKQKKTLGINDHTVVVWNAIYRKKFLSDNGIMYFDNLRSSEDISFTARATFCANKTVPVTDTFLHYRKDIKTSISNNISLNKIFTDIKANEITTDFLNRIYEKTQFKDYKTAYLRCVWRCNNTFKACLNLEDFNTTNQEKYLEQFIKIIQKYKGNKKDLLTIDFGLYFLLNSNMQNYTNVIKGMLKIKSLLRKKGTKCQK